MVTRLRGGGPGKPVFDPMPRRPESEPLEITENRGDGRVRLTLAGHLDYATAPDLAQRIHALRSAGYSALELDMTRVRYFDATGLAVLMSARRKFVGELIVLRGASAYLRKVLDVTGLGRFFAFAEEAP